MFASRLRVLATVFLTISSIAAQAVVPSATYVGRSSTGSDSDNVTVSLNVPESSNNELYFHFSAPIAFSWAAFGIGTRMAGSLMFVVYHDGDNNVTVSPRLGTGHVMPQHTDGVSVELLSGSGIHDDVYVVNARCSDCREWSGGSADVSSDSQHMIWALGPSSSSIESTDLNQNIQEHVVWDQFTLDLAAATGEGGVPSAFANSTNTEIDEGGANGRGGGRGGGDGSSRGVIRFHAFLMVVSFLVIFPLGYILLRVFDRVLLHWITQSIAAVLVCAGTGAGIAYSVRNGMPLTFGHQIFGFVILGILVAAWIIGFTGHAIFRKTGKPAKIMKAHRVLGPAVMLFGLANCIFGFQFARSTTGAIAMAVASVLLLVGLVAATFFARRRKMRKGAMNTPAAANFREGQMDTHYDQHTGYGQASIPLNSYDPPPPQYR